jgi:hypothetical protein
LVGCSKEWASSMRRGSLHAMPVKRTPNGEGLASNPFGNAEVGALGTIPNGSMTGRVSGPGDDGGAARAWKQQCVEVVRFHDLVDPVRAGERDVFGTATGAAGPSNASHLLRSRFIPYFSTTEQLASLPLAPSMPPHEFHNQEIVVLILADDARDVGGIDDDGPLLLEKRYGVGHDFRLFGVEASARFFGAGRRRLVIEEGARDADARALEARGPS